MTCQSRISILMFTLILPYTASTLPETEHLTMELLDCKTCRWINLRVNQTQNRVDVGKAQPFTLIVSGGRIRIDAWHPGKEKFCIKPLSNGDVDESDPIKCLPGLLSFSCFRCQGLNATPGELRERGCHGYYTDQALNCRPQSRFKPTVTQVTLPLTLTETDGIRALKLNGNHLRLLPPTFFSKFPTLQRLELRNNSFSRSSAMGFDSGNTLAICYLDVSHNALRVLDGQGFSALRNLTTLRLSNNLLTTVEHDSLVGLAKLVSLHLDHNQMNFVPPNLFRNTPRLAVLDLSYNDLSSLPQNFLSDLPALNELHVAYNMLTTLEWLRKYERTSGLEILDLRANLLTELGSLTFESHTNLNALDLRDNRIEHLTAFTFWGLTKLRYLSLGNNHLKRINGEAMAGLRSLTILKLDSNFIEAIEVKALKDMVDLHSLNLTRNKLRTIPYALSPLKTLRDLDLSENGIADLANSALNDLNMLSSLNLIGNHIENITKDAFTQMLPLKTLSLAKNQIQRIEPDAFSNVSGLQYLRLDSNFIEEIRTLFRNMNNLISLDLSRNRLRYFDYSIIPRNLQSLDIHDNHIASLTNDAGISMDHQLVSLDASFNKITKLTRESLLNSIEFVSLKNNRLMSIAPFAFLEKVNLTHVDITNNRLQQLGGSVVSFLSSSVGLAGPSPQILLSGNPFKCDCHSDLVQQCQLRLMATPKGLSTRSHRYFRIIDLDSVHCNVTPVRGGSHEIVPLKSAKPAQLLCSYKTYCADACKCCGVSHCDCRDVCPKNCSCYYHRSLINVVDCHARRYREPPAKLPSFATEIYLDGNNISKLTRESFANNRKVTTLFLNNSNVRTIEPHSFRSMASLEVLHLEDNQIHALYGYEFDVSSSLTELYLSHNSIRYLSIDTLVHLPNLRILHLDRNDLVRLPVRVLWSLHHLTNVLLAGNPWSCGPDFDHSLSEFFGNKRRQIVRDLGDIVCSSNRTSTIWKSNGNDESLLLDHTERVVLIAVGVMLSLAVVGFIVISYHSKICLSLFRHDWVWRFVQPTSAVYTNLFDIFVTYSDQDTAFVIDVLIPQLKSRLPSCRLCLQHRHPSIMEHYLSHSIYRTTIDSSKKLVVILSRDFLESEKTTLCRLISANAGPNEGNCIHKLIVLCHGQISYSDLDVDSRNLLKTSTLLHSDDEKFGHKLCQALST